MKKTISKIPFAGTKEQEARLQAVIDESKDNPSLLIHVMQQAQLYTAICPLRFR